jgi:hypothetical protein
MLSALHTHEPVSRNKLIELNYAYTNNQTILIKTITMTPLPVNMIQPTDYRQNYFKNGFVASRVGANFRVQEKI